MRKWWLKVKRGCGLVQVGVARGQRSEGARVWTHSATSQRWYAWPHQARCIARYPTGLELGAGWVEVARARGLTKVGFHFGDTA